MEVGHVGVGCGGVDHEGMVWGRSCRGGLGHGWGGVGHGGVGWVM